MPPTLPPDLCLVAVREVQTDSGLDVELASYPSVPQADLREATAQLMAEERAGHVLVMRSVVPLDDLLAWFRAHRPIKDHPELVGVVQASSL